MNTQTHYFQTLPEILLNHLLTFLHPKEIYLTLTLTSKFFKDFISSSNYLKLQVSLRSFGISHQKLKSISNLSDSDLQSIFFPKFQNFHHQTYQDIPFYGFYTDGGVYVNNPEYWVDTLFVKGAWTICSKGSENIHIKGVLDENFEKVIKGLNLFNQLSQDIRKNYIQDFSDENNDYILKSSSNFLIEAFEEEIKKKKHSIEEEVDDWPDSDEEYIPNSKKESIKKGIKKGLKTKKQPKKRNQNWKALNQIWFSQKEESEESAWKQYSKQEILQKIVPSMDFLRKTEVKWKKVKDSNELEIYDDKIHITPKNYSIIKGFEVSRQGPITCPVKTCMVFISDYEIDVKQEEIFDIFKKAKTIQDIKSIYQTFGEDLPSIYHSNCPELVNLTLAKPKSINCYPEIAKFVIFNNNEKKLSRNVRPIAWLQFVNKDLKILKVKLDDVRLFGGVFVIVKLIDFENRKAEFRDQSEVINIDINYVSFFGDVVALKTEI